ncbi:GNAT family N-acetyltransferase [Candidatus Leptofilum sp.]|uniref:GNAT family N-acetyltransferase n=1 Tax=Candidatus Leptofilum sp. TaxID=3241576 RepID=UPI003B5C1EC8
MINISTTERKVTREARHIRPFHPTDQDATKKLILNGLTDHWGTLDPTLNPDLNNISRSYQGGTFLLVIIDSEIVGCGALIQEKGAKRIGRIVRMSVKKENRRQGIGQLLLKHLETAAKRRKFNKIVLETTETWHNAITFYQTNGYTIIGYWGGDTHFEKII